MHGSLIDAYLFFSEVTKGMNFATIANVLYSYFNIEKNKLIWSG